MAAHKNAMSTCISFSYKTYLIQHMNCFGDTGDEILILKPCPMHKAKSM